MRRATGRAMRHSYFPDSGGEDSAEWSAVISQIPHDEAIARLSSHVKYVLSHEAEPSVVVQPRSDPPVPMPSPISPRSPSGPSWNRRPVSTENLSISASDALPLIALHVGPLQRFLGQASPIRVTGHLVSVTEVERSAEAAAFLALVQAEPNKQVLIVDDVHVGKSRCSFSITMHSMETRGAPPAVSRVAGAVDAIMLDAFGIEISVGYDASQSMAEVAVGVNATVPDLRIDLYPVAPLHVILTPATQHLLALEAAHSGYILASSEGYHLVESPDDTLSSGAAGRFAGIWVSANSGPACNSSMIWAAATQFMLSRSIGERSLYQDISTQGSIQHTFLVSYFDLSTPTPKTPVRPLFFGCRTTVSPNTCVGVKPLVALQHFSYVADISLLDEGVGRGVEPGSDRLALFGRLKPVSSKEERRHNADTSVGRPLTTPVAAHTAHRSQPSHSEMQSTTDERSQERPSPPPPPSVSRPSARTEHEDIIALQREIIMKQQLQLETLARELAELRAGASHSVSVGRDSPGDKHTTEEISAPKAPPLEHFTESSFRSDTPAMAVQLEPCADDVSFPILRAPSNETRDGVSLGVSVSGPPLPCAYLPYTEPTDEFQFPVISWSSVRSELPVDEGDSVAAIIDKYRSSKPNP